MMKFLFQFGICVFLISSLGSCKTTFEKIRTSNDPNLILETADNYYEEEDYVKAQSLYDIIIPFFRGRKEAEEIFFKYAYTYYFLQDYMLASHYFDNYTKTFANSSKREEASYMSAYSHYQMSPIFRLDQTFTEKAIEEMQLFVNNYPTSERVETCNRLIDEMREKLEKKAFDQGKLYFRIREYQASITAFKNMLIDFPDTKNVEEINYYIIKSAYLLAENSVYDKKKERFEETIKYYNQFKKKFPRSKYLKELRNDIQYSNKQIKSLSA